MKKKNTTIAFTDKMVANLLEHFEKNFKGKIDGDKYAKIFARLEEDRTHAIVPMENLEDSDMGWALGKGKTGAVILGSHFLPMEPSFVKQTKGMLITKSQKDHEWGYVPQSWTTFSKMVEFAASCPQAEDFYKTHIGNVYDSVLDYPIKFKDKAQHIADHLVDAGLLDKSEADRHVEAKTIFTIRKGGK